RGVYEAACSSRSPSSMRVFARADVRRSAWNISPAEVRFQDVSANASKFSGAAVARSSHGLGIQPALGQLRATLCAGGRPPGAACGPGTWAQAFPPFPHCGREWLLLRWLLKGYGHWGCGEALLHVHCGAGVQPGVVAHLAAQACKARVMLGQ